MSSFRLTLLRHGETLAPAGTVIGHTDAPLSPLGQMQLARRQEHFSRFPPTSIASSDLCRCAGFARSLAQSFNLDCWVDQQLREMNFGAVDGLPRAGWSPELQADWAQWQRDPAQQQLTGAESWAEFSARVNTACQTWLQSGEGEHRVLITHGGVAKALLLNWLGLDSRRHQQFWLAHSGMVTLYWDDQYLPIVQGIDNEV